LAGARDIIAELINEEASTRQSLRQLFHSEGLLQSQVVKGKEEEGSKYRDYFELLQPIIRMPGHRVLAIFRGEAEEFLKSRSGPPQEKGSSHPFPSFYQRSKSLFRPGYFGYGR